MIQLSGKEDCSISLDSPSESHSLDTGMYRICKLKLVNEAYYLWPEESNLADVKT